MTTPAAWVEAWRYSPSRRWPISSSFATSGSASRASWRRGSPAMACGERDGVRRVHRHELAQPVDLAIGHLQHAADVAQHRARLELAEGDDVGDAVGAVALAHIGDHLVAAVLAEIDVEVRHRHALGVEEALEQEPEAHGVEIGDGQRPGDERARAGAAPRSDRDPLRLRPLDEVGDDEEVALIVHAGDDVELEGKAIGVSLGVEARRRALLLEPPGEASLRLAAKLRGLGLALRLGAACRRGTAAGSARAPAAGRSSGAPPRWCSRSPRADRRTAQSSAARS